MVTVNNNEMCGQRNSYHCGNSEFKIVEKAKGNHCTIFLKATWQCTGNQEKDSGERHGCLRLEGTGH